MFLFEYTKEKEKKEFTKKLKKKLILKKVENILFI
jgi:hypothetical protein